MSSLAELRLVGARLVLGRVHSWEIPPVADRALMNRVYSPALAELATLPHPIMADVAPLLRRAMEELGLALPSRTEAAWQVARSCIERLAAGEGPPDWIVEELIWLADAVADVLPTRSSIGDGLDAAKLIGVFWMYLGEDYGDPESHRAAIEARRPGLLDSLAREARAWLERHPASA